MLRQQDRIRGKARDRLALSSSRHPSREDRSHRDFPTVVTAVARRDIRFLCVDDHQQDPRAQDRILAHLSRRRRITLISFRGAHLSRRKRMDVTLITFQEVEDPIDRASSSNNSKAVSSRNQVFRHHVGYWYMLRSHRARDAVV